MDKEELKTYIDSLALGYTMRDETIPATAEEHRKDLAKFALMVVKNTVGFGDISESVLGQIFENSSDCYADTRNECNDTVPPIMIEGDVIQAITKEKFIEVLKKHFR